MYQFIVATRSSGTCVGAENPNWSSAGATIEDISTMSLNGNRTNKWASRAVVALQLAAWSAVGIVLLEKGITTLQKSPHTPLNVSQEITTPVSSSDFLHSRVMKDSTIIDRLPQTEMDSLPVIPIDGDQSTKPSRSDLENSSITETDEERRNADGVDKSVNSLRQQLEETDGTRTNNGASKNGQLSRSNDTEGKNSFKNTTTVNKVEGRENKDEETKEEKEKKEAADGDEPSQAKTWPSPVTIKVIMDNLEEHRWESRKRLRLARLNGGGGAAAAVAMVAVGAVMLVLGPAVIILRALDERRQERRFLKLSGEEDLPPSYEEATVEFGQAPTYSSLNLDSIHTTPASPAVNDSENSCITGNCRRGSCGC